MSLLLDGCEEQEGEDGVAGFEISQSLLENCEPVMKVDVDLSTSAQLNVRRYFEIKKKSAAKEAKTREAADVAVRQAEVAAARDFAKF